ncbi:hypothetical protein ACTI_60760 [Actinoplanes sp. OR16]|nr:hypothetical protein ACTI_60760 [Actinoplanes sp. OR16]
MQVVVLTALPVEYDAVARHLHGRVVRRDRVGTQFEVGSITGGSRVAVAELGPGNYAAALVTSHAIEMFHPKAILFVGIAGALHSDLQLGDVVVAPRVYSYQGGMAKGDDFLARPQSYNGDWALSQSARAAARAWRAAPLSFAVHHRPIAAGEVVLNSRTHPLAEQLRRNYNDAAAIEMESAGMAHAGQMHQTPTLTVRGISDRADGGKELVDAAGSQPAAADHAAEFAMAVITDYLAGVIGSPNQVAVAGDVRRQSSHREVAAHDPATHTGPSWRRESGPLDVAWRSAITRRRQSFESPALELHLVPIDPAPHIEVRRLAALAEELAAHLPARVPVETDVDDQGARAVSSDSTSGPHGLFVGRHGQRSAWEPLPKDSMGAVLDETWLLDHLAASIITLITLSPRSAARYAPALAVMPADMLTVGRLDRMPRSHGSGFLMRAKLEVPPEESVPADDLGDLASDVAAELAARLLMAFHRGNR